MKFFQRKTKEEVQNVLDASALEAQCALQLAIDEQMGALQEAGTLQQDQNINIGLSLKLKDVPVLMYDGKFSGVEKNRAALAMEIEADAMRPQDKVKGIGDALRDVLVDTQEPLPRPRFSGWQLEKIDESEWTPDVSLVTFSHDNVVMSRLHHSKEKIFYPVGHSLKEQEKSGREMAGYITQNANMIAKRIVHAYGLANQKQEVLEQDNPAADVENPKITPPAKEINGHDRADSSGSSGPDSDAPPQR